MNYVRRSPINGSVKAVFIAMFAAVLLIGSSPAKAQTGCEPACSGYPANSQSLTCACRAVCSRLICPAGSGAPTFIAWSMILQIFSAWVSDSAPP